MNTNQIWEFISDDGHGWLAIPTSVYKYLGIKATRFSYYSKSHDKVYLEEDCDAEKAIEAMKKLGLVPTIKEVRISGECFVRRCFRME